MQKRFALNLFLLKFICWCPALTHNRSEYIAPLVDYTCCWIYYALQHFSIANDFVNHKKISNKTQYVAILFHIFTICVLDELFFHGMLCTACLYEDFLFEFHDNCIVCMNIWLLHILHLVFSKAGLCNCLMVALPARVLDSFMYGPSVFSNIGLCIRLIVMNKLWISYEQVMNKTWTCHEQVMSN